MQSLHRFALQTPNCLEKFETMLRIISALHRVLAKSRLVPKPCLQTLSLDCVSYEEPLMDQLPLELA